MYRCDLIVKEILLVKPDIVCLQEVEQELFDGILSRKLAAGGFQGFFVPMTRGCAVGAATYYRTATFDASLVVPVSLGHLVRGFRSQFPRQVASLLGSENVSLATHPPCVDYPMLVGFSDGTYCKTASGSVLPCTAINGDARQRKRDADLASVLAPAQGSGASPQRPPLSALLPRAQENAQAVAELRTLEGQHKRLKVSLDAVAHVPAVFPNLHWAADPQAVAEGRAMLPNATQRITKAVGGLPACFSKIHNLSQVALVLVLRPVLGGGPPIVVTNYHAFWDPRWSDIKSVHTWLLLQWLQQLDNLLNTGVALPWDWVGAQDGAPAEQSPPTASSSPTEDTVETDTPAAAAGAAGGSHFAADQPHLAHFILGDFNSNPKLQESDLVQVPPEALGTTPGLLQLLSDSGSLPYAVAPRHFTHPSTRTGGFPPTITSKQDWLLQDPAKLAIAKALPNATEALLKGALHSPWQWTNAYESVWGRNLPWSNWTPGFRGMLDYIFTTKGLATAVAVLTDEVKCAGSQSKSMTQVMKDEGFRGCPSRLTGSDHLPLAADFVFE